MANNLMHFDPFRDLATFDQLRGIDALFNELKFLPNRLSGESESCIRIDVAETEKAYAVKADIPGVKKENIKVSIAGNQVSITTEIRDAKEDKLGGELVRTERYSGQQSRIFTLSQDVDDTRAEAKYTDGVLELILPKKPGSAGAKQIAIH